MCASSIPRTVGSNIVVGSSQSYHHPHEISVDWGAVDRILFPRILCAQTAVSLNILIRKGTHQGPPVRLH